jgi:signal transduction histidine kinase
MWDQLPEGEVREYIGIIDRRAGELSRMIDQLLISSNVEAADIQANTQTIYVPAALTNVAKLEHGVDFTVRCKGDLSISADPVALQQILINYMSNARKYGGPPFSVEASRRDGWVEIMVRDGGQGVPDEVVARLFERFGPGPRDVTREGLGLGLSIVRALAQAQGGEAWYEPNAPRGATFGVRLPIVVPEPVDAPVTSLTDLAAAS